MSQNMLRWILAIGIGAISGLLDVATDTNFPGWWDIARHIIIGVGAVVIPLKMTLTETGK